MSIRLLFILLGLPCLTIAQTLSSEIPGAAVVQLDLVNGLVKDDMPVPYDARVIFKAEVIKLVQNSAFNKLFVFYKADRCPDPSIKTVDTSFQLMTEWNRPDSTIAGQSKIASFVSRIEPEKFFSPNRNYCMIIRRTDQRNITDDFQQQVSFRTASKFGDYVKLDFGLGFSPPPNAFIGTASVHLYAKPTNEFVNLADRYSFNQQLLRRTSLFIGVAPLTLASNTKQDISSFTSVGNLIFGLGFRAPTFYPKKKYAAAENADLRALSSTKIYRKDFNQALRFNLGFMLFKQANPSPLIDRKITLIEPFFSLTYDSTLKDLLAPIALLLGIK